MTHNLEEPLLHLHVPVINMQNDPISEHNCYYFIVYFVFYRSQFDMKIPAFMPVEGWVRFCSPQNISGASQRDSIAALSHQSRRGIVLMNKIT